MTRRERLATWLLELIQRVTRRMRRGKIAYRYPFPLQRWRKRLRYICTKQDGATMNRNERREALKTATKQSTLTAAAYESGRMMRLAGVSLRDAYPVSWPAKLRRLYADGHALCAVSAPASWNK
jgi:hypothetical protein